VKRFGGLTCEGVTQGHRQHLDSIERRQLPTQINRHYEAILYRLRDITAYFPKKIKEVTWRDQASFRENLSSVYAGTDLAAWSHQNWNIFKKCLHLFGKKPLMIKFYIATPMDVVVCKICENCPTENRWNRALFRWPKKQNFGSLSNCRDCADSAQSLQWPAPNI